MQCQNILVFHAIIGCDKSSAFYVIGRVNALSKFKPNKPVTVLLFRFAYQKLPKENITEHGKQFMKTLYGI